MIVRSTNIKQALRHRQRGFLLNPFRFGGGGGPPPWDPDTGVTSATLKLWLDPSNSAYRSLTGSSVNSLTCRKTGLVFTSSTTKPSLNTAGGYFIADSIDFGADSNSRWVNNATGVSITVPLTIFAVYYWRNNAATYGFTGLFKGSASNAIQGAVGLPYNGLAKWPGGGTPGYATLSSSGEYIETLNAFAQNTKGLLELNSGANPAGGSIYKNNSLLTKSSSGTIWDTPQLFNSLGSSDTLYRPNAAVGEVLAYQGTPDSTDRAAIISYLMTKWGLP